jgi:hypothetical protein
LYQPYLPGKTRLQLTPVGCVDDAIAPPYTGPEWERHFKGATWGPFDPIDNADAVFGTENCPADSP